MCQSCQSVQLCGHRRVAAAHRASWFARARMRGFTRTSCSRAAECAKLQSQRCGTVVQATRLPDVCKNVEGCAKRNGDGEMGRPHRCAVPRCPKCSSPSAASRRRFAALRVPCLQRRTCDRQAESSAQTGLGGPIPRQNKYMSLNIDVISRRNSSDCASASLTCAAGSSCTHQNRNRPIGSTVR